MSNKDGIVSRKSFEIPGAAYIFVYDITAAQSGEIALIGTATSGDSKAGTFVARIDPSKEAVISRVTPYVPRKIAIAGDGTLWTVGWMKTETGADGENNVVKRFDAKGKSIGTMLPRPQFRKGLPASIDTPDFSVLRASRDRIAWLTAGNEYIEWSLDGRTITRIEGPPLTEKHHDPVCLALSDDGQVIASSQSVELEKWDVWVLNRATRAWRQIDITGERLPRWGQLLGFDNDTLVTGFNDGRVLRFKRQIDDEK